MEKPPPEVATGPAGMHLNVGTSQGSGVVQPGSEFGCNVGVENLAAKEEKCAPGANGDQPAPLKCGINVDEGQDQLDHTNNKQSALDAGRDCVRDRQSRPVSAPAELSGGGRRSRSGGVAAEGLQRFYRQSNSNPGLARGHKLCLSAPREATSTDPDFKAVQFCVVQRHHNTDLDTGAWWEAPRGTADVRGQQSDCEQTKSRPGMALRTTSKDEETSTPQTEGRSEWRCSQMFEQDGSRVGSFQQFARDDVAIGVTHPGTSTDLGGVRTDVQTSLDFRNAAVRLKVRCEKRLPCLRAAWSAKNCVILQY